MQLTRKQEEGLKIALDRWTAGEKYTAIAGYAGTGKSTLVKYIVAAMHLPENKIKYIAYTGKAANVLKNKGNKNAITAHKLLYYSERQKDGKFRYRPRPHLEDWPYVVIVDEVSMLPKKLWDLLCTHDVYIIACGDPEQLPPIQDGKEEVDNHVLDNPHIFLDEVMRQAQESEIIRLSMWVREGRDINSFPYENNEVMHLRRSDINIDHLQWADQILCATNRTKSIFNNMMRDALGFSGPPQIGDKVINTHNNWDIHSTNGNPFTNGVIGYIQDDLEFVNSSIPPYVRGYKSFDIPLGVCSISGDEEGEVFQLIDWDLNKITTGKPSLTGAEEYKLYKANQRYLIPNQIDYGYAITVWKAQGSEWNKVLLCSESNWPRGQVERRKFLYTGITRAVNKLVVVTP